MMNAKKAGKFKILHVLIIGFLFITACMEQGNKPDKSGNLASMANPASVKCLENGFRLEIRKDKSGGEFGVCINSDGDECEEWAYFRKECSLEGLNRR